MAEGRRTDTGQAEQVGGLSVVTTATGGVRVMALAGEIDHHTGGQLSRALDVAGAERPRIVIDMRQVTFMDSTGINILIAAYRPSPKSAAGSAWPDPSTPSCESCNSSASTTSSNATPPSTKPWPPEPLRHLHQHPGG
ncbi:STAS domain-containing protein [Streptomyces cellulosae]|uniref:STAS domain-containing protein n=1 Tax=Streptomyces cellulosae TaxID=1968 RepID=A0ABW6JKK8_STRCE